MGGLLLAAVMATGFAPVRGASAGAVLSVSAVVEAGCAVAAPRTSSPPAAPADALRCTAPVARSVEVSSAAEPLAAAAAAPAAVSRIAASAVAGPRLVISY